MTCLRHSKRVIDKARARAPASHCPTRRARACAARAQWPRATPWPWLLLLAPPPLLLLLAPPPLLLLAPPPPLLLLAPPPPLLLLAPPPLLLLAPPPPLLLLAPPPLLLLAPPLFRLQTRAVQLNAQDACKAAQAPRRPHTQHAALASSGRGGRGGANVPVAGTAQESAAAPAVFPSCSPVSPDKCNWCWLVHVVM